MKQSLIYLTLISCALLPGCHKKPANAVIEQGAPTPTPIPDLKIRIVDQQPHQVSVKFSSERGALLDGRLLTPIRLCRFKGEDGGYYSLLKPMLQQVFDPTAVRRVTAGTPLEIQIDLTEIFPYESFDAAQIVELSIVYSPQLLAGQNCEVPKDPDYVLTKTISEHVIIRAKDFISEK
jgi:hypothetical protein